MNDTTRAVLMGEIARMEESVETNRRAVENAKVELERYEGWLAQAQERLADLRTDLDAQVDAYPTAQWAMIHVPHLIDNTDRNRTLCWRPYPLDSLSDRPIPAGLCRRCRSAAQVKPYWRRMGWD